MLRRAGVTMRLVCKRGLAALIGGWLGLRGYLPARLPCSSSACPAKR